MRSLVWAALVGAVSLGFMGTVSALQEPAKPPAVTHDLEGRDNCVMCHSGGIPDTPVMPAESHEGREAATCLWCHGPESAMQTTVPKLISHDLEGRDNCLMCHSGGMPETPVVPEDHEGRENAHCQMCHKPAA
jgi:hypothetical protein